METSLFLNDKNGKFIKKELPVEAQFSPVYAIHCSDFDGDGKKDLLLAGNFSAAKPEVGIYDANYGLILKGDGQGNFKTLGSLETGLNVKGDVRNIEQVKLKGGGDKLIFIMNNAAPLFYDERRNN